MHNDISAIILTYNEEPNVKRCLESIQGFCEVFVVDSGSVDRTLEICRHYTDNIYENEYINHASQWQWALENLPIETQWILALDADFVVTEGLKDQISSRLSYLPDDVNGIYVQHRYIFGGNEIRFGGTKKYWLRMVRRSRARADQSDLVDFRFVVPGRTIKFDGIVREYNVHDEDISTWLRKQDKFSLRLAVEEELRRSGLLAWEKKPDLFGNSDERFMYLRDHWLSLPLFVRPVLYFIYRYVVMLGFLDGVGGFLYHFLQGLCLRVIVDWKIRQIRKLNLKGKDLIQFRDTMLMSRTGSVSKVYKTLTSSNHPSPA